ncbi:filamentous hemagglutinin N-terminal domain-containing protein [Zooshikella marina]|uniref:two-partner secretion domain-containing protein n=1 Tax=Zooshikella ganghwensis TaxID=202772 RepID=UPI001BB0D225|nr:filamentous hemagglutinin N-terminal domain-containing protein [Zooshikella ganghwensis]MBU2707994.1 filamentous hemagglutinin N-terminal domain-containing protein [Zooshikella ganghwensis]
MINEVTVKPLVASIRQSILAATLVVPSLVMAAPQNGTVTHGNATITQSGTTTTINQASDRAVIDWQSFNVNKNEKVHFDQPGISAATLNRINDQNPSQIHGQVTANGKVYLVNPNGIIFGKDATVNVGGFVASGMNVSDEHAASFFNDDKLIFSGNSNSKIENNGLINASSGSVALIGKRVVNNGIITAKLNTSLIGSDKASLDFDGDGLISIEVDRELIVNDNTSREVVNNGEINAQYIKLSANATNNAINSLVNNDGILKAEATTIENGKITLSANKVINKGELKVLARIGTDTGGTIEIAADKVELSGKVNTFWNKPKANINIDAKDVTLAISESSKINDLVIKAEKTQFEQQLNDLDVNNIKLEGNVVFAENTKITATDSVDLGEAQVVGDQRLTIKANNEVILGDIHKSITPLDELTVGSKSLLLAGDIRANYFDLNNQGSIKLDKNSSISTESDLTLPMVQGDYSLALKTPGYIYFKDSVDVNSLSLDTDRLYLASDLSLNGVFDIQKVNDIILYSYLPISISNQGGDIRLDKHKLTNNNRQLKLSAPGHTIALGEVSLNALEIFGNTPSNLILSDNIYARKSIDFSDVEKITLAGDIDLVTGDYWSEIKLSKLVTGDNNLNLNSRAGNIQLQKVDIKGKLNTDTQAKILLNGNVTADSGVNLAAGNGLILQNDVLVASQSGNVVLNGDISGSNKLNLVGNDVYLQKVNVGSLAMEGGDFLSVLGDITTDGDITLNNIKKVHLAGSRKINSGSGTIDVQGSHLVNATSLELNASIIKLGDLGHEGNRINTVRLKNTDELVLAGDIYVFNTINFDHVGTLSVANDSKIDISRWSSSLDLANTNVRGNGDLSFNLNKGDLTIGLINIDDNLTSKNVYLTTLNNDITSGSGEVKLNSDYVYLNQDVVVSAYKGVDLSSVDSVYGQRNLSLLSSDGVIRLSRIGGNSSIADLNISAKDVFLNDSVNAKNITFNSTNRIHIENDLQLKHLSNDLNLANTEILGNHQLGLYSNGDLQLGLVDLGAGELTVSSIGNITLADDITANNGVYFKGHGSVTLTDDVVINSKQSHLDLANNTLSGKYGLTLNAKKLTLGKLDTSSPLKKLVVNHAQNVILNDDIVVTETVDLTNNGRIQLSQPLAIRALQGDVRLENSNLFGSELNIGAKNITLGKLTVDKLGFQAQSLTLTDNIKTQSAFSTAGIDTVNLVGTSIIDTSFGDADINLQDSLVKGDNLYIKAGQGNVLLGKIDNKELTANNTGSLITSDSISTENGVYFGGKGDWLLANDTSINVKNGSIFVDDKHISGNYGLNLSAGRGNIYLGDADLAELLVSTRNMHLKGNVEVSKGVLDFTDVGTLSVDGNRSLSVMHTSPSNTAIDLKNTQVQGSGSLNLINDRGSINLGQVNIDGRFTVGSTQANYSENINLYGNLTAEKGFEFKNGGSIVLHQDVLLSSPKYKLDFSHKTLAGNYALNINANSVRLGKFSNNSLINVLTISHSDSIDIYHDIITQSGIYFNNNKAINTYQNTLFNALDGQVFINNSIVNGNVTLFGNTVSLDNASAYMLNVKAKDLNLAGNIVTYDGINTVGTDLITLRDNVFLSAHRGAVNLSSAQVKGNGLTINANGGDVNLSDVAVDALTVLNTGVLTTDGRIQAVNDVHFNGVGLWLLEHDTSVASTTGSIFAADKYLRGNHTLLLAAPNGYIKLASAHIGSLNISAQEVQLEGDLSVKQGGLDFRHVRTLDLAKYASLQTQQSAGNINLSHTSVVGRGNLALYSGLGRTLLGRVSLDGQLIAQNQSRVDVYQPVSANKGISLEQTPEVYLHNSGIFTSDAGDIHLPNVVGSGYGFLAKAAGNVHVGSLSTANVNIQSGKGVVLGDVNTNYLNVIAQKDINLNGNTNALQAASIISSQGQVNMFSNRALNTVGNAVLNGYSGVNISHIKADDVRITSKVGNIHTLPTPYGRNIIARRAELNTRGEIGSNYQPVNLLVSKDLLIYNARKAVLAGLFNKPTLVNTSETTTIMLPKVSKDAAKTALITLEDTRYFDSSIFIDGVTLFTYSDEDLLQVERLESMTTMKE